MNKQLKNMPQECVNRKAPKIKIKGSELQVLDNDEGMEAMRQATGTSDKNLMR